VRRRDGALWVGTRNGLNRLDPDSGKVEQIKANPQADALSEAIISSLAIDRRGRLWVGTHGGGICVMTGRDALGEPVFERIGIASRPVQRHHHGAAVGPGRPHLGRHRGQHRRDRFQHLRARALSAPTAWRSAPSSSAPAPSRRSATWCSAPPPAWRWSIRAA
jgi:hypothetical protein